MLVGSPVLCSLLYHMSNSTLVLLFLVLSLFLLLNCFGLLLLLLSFSLSQGSIRNSLSTLPEVEIRFAYTLPSLDPTL
uniref:Putative ovule protein n=1 Tax=Solanum chacoense TaxID=4108 RepID=A0A0V0GR76_SOLCH